MVSAVSTAFQFISGSPMPMKTMLVGSPPESAADLAHLPGDLAARQVAREAHHPGRAEGAAQRAAGLRRDAERQARPAGDQHRLDRLAVRQPPEELPGAVRGGPLPCRPEAPRGDGPSSSSPESGGSSIAPPAGHRRLPQPAKDLAAPIRGEPAVRRPSGPELALAGSGRLDPRNRGSGKAPASDHGGKLTGPLGLALMPARRWPVLLTDLLSPERVRRAARGTGQAPRLRELSHLLADRPAAISTTCSGPWRNARRCLSTGIGFGVAIPHGRSPRSPSWPGGGVSPAPVPSMPSMGSRSALFLIVGPEASAGQHVKVLAGIARLVRGEQLRKHLLPAERSEEFYNVLLDAEAPDLAPPRLP